jgi:arylsulfatase A-like enzyme
MRRRPNFLVIMTDQHRADHLGCYGNQAVHTPHIDSLAASGLTFDRCYTSSPICMPNRAAFLTGRMPSVNGVRHNGLPLPLEAVTVADLLRAAGYGTALIGKSHLQSQSAREIGDPEIWPGPFASGEPPPEGLRQAVRTRRTGPEYLAERLSLWAEDPDRKLQMPYYGFDHVRFANGHGDAVQGHYTSWLAARHPDPNSLRGSKNALPPGGITAPQAWRTRMPEELYPTRYIESATVDYLRTRAARREEPFLLWCSFPDPHHPYTPPGRYWDMYDPRQIAVPASHGHVDPDEPAVLRRLRADYASGALRPVNFLTFVADAQQTREIIALSYGMISMIDDSVGRILGELSQLGLADDTVVIFTSDHGDYMGDHSLMLKQGLHYEGVIHVPFIWKDPAVAASRRDTLVGTIDMAPSMLARAGLRGSYGMQGFDVVGSATAPAREGLLIEEDELGIHMGAARGLRLWTLVHDRWRITVWHGEPQGELFDREADPHEMRNRWSDATLAGVKADLLERLLRERMRLGDTVPFSERSA